MRDPSLFPLLLPWTGGAAPLVAVAWPQIKETWIEAEYPLRSGLGGVAAALRAADLGVRTPGGATVGHYRLHLGTSQPLSGRSAELPIAAALLCAWHRALVRPLLSEPWPVDRAPVAASGKLDEEGRVLTVEGWPEKCAALARFPDVELLCAPEDARALAGIGLNTVGITDVDSLWDWVVQRQEAQLSPEQQQRCMRLREQLHPRSPLPPEWPRPTPHFCALWERAVALGRPVGFLGVEQLLLAGGLKLEPYRPDLWTFEAMLRDSLIGVPSSGPPAPTVRLRRAGAVLRAGFGLSDLLQSVSNSIKCITEVKHIHEQSPVIQGQAESQEVMYHSTSLVHSIDPTLRRAAATLRRPILSQAEAWIVGGPEDGRCLRLRTGATLGRASAGSIVDIAFYAESQVSDRYLSKRVGDWDGRHLRLEQSADLRNGQHLTVGTAYAPGSGDLLDLTPRTTLLFGPPEITLE